MSKGAAGKQVGGSRRISVPIVGALIALSLIVGVGNAFACPNDSFRGGLSAALPECRAYEKVSPDDKGGFSAARRDGGVFSLGATAWGSFTLGDDAFKYVAGGPFDEPESSAALGTGYLFHRGAEGWTADPLVPPAVPPTVLLAPTYSLAVAADESHSIVSTPAKLLPSAPESRNLFGGNAILYLRDDLTHTYQLISRAPVTGSLEGETRLVAATPDLHTAIFETTIAMLPGVSPGVANLYEWTDDGTELGQLRLVGYKPAPAGEEAFETSTAAQPGQENSTDERRSLATDGRHVIFNSGGQLYMRIDGSRTIAISASQRSTPDPAGTLPATYLAAAEDASAVVFAGGEKLTDDSAATETEPDLYRYEPSSGRLADLTAGAGPAGAIGVIGASTNADIVYFTATSVLVPGQGVAGEANIYRWRADGTLEGEINFIATAPRTTFESELGNLAGDNTRSPVNGNGGRNPEQVSANGRWLAFISTLPLTGQATAGEPQIFRYDGTTGQILCASCLPDGGRTKAGASLGSIGRTDPPRVVSEDGVVAFQSREALVPADTNGQIDVYDFDGGAPQLISGGKSPERSTLLGLTPDGTNLYFGTGQQLLASDTDDLDDIYDARVDGGFAEPSAPAPCEGSACRGPGTSRGGGTPGSSQVSGGGNLDERCVASRRQARRLTTEARRLRRITRGVAGAGARKIARRSARLDRQAKRKRRQATTCTRNVRRTAR